MTREEAIKRIKMILEECTEDEDAVCYVTSDDADALDTAIKALEQGQTAIGIDCIDRAQAQTEIEMNASRYTLSKEHGGMGQVAWSDYLIEVSDAVDIIRHLPSVTPTQNWIPCSKKMPKEDEYVNNVCKYYLVQDEYGDMHVAHYTHVGWIPTDSLSALGDNVVAWQPLPEKYKAGTESEE